MRPPALPRDKARTRPRSLARLLDSRPGSTKWVCPGQLLLQGPCLLLVGPGLRLPAWQPHLLSMHGAEVLQGLRIPQALGAALLLLLLLLGPAAARGLSCSASFLGCQVSCSGSFQVGEGPRAGPAILGGAALLCCKPGMGGWWLCPGLLGFGQGLVSRGAGWLGAGRCGV